MLDEKLMQLTVFKPQSYPIQTTRYGIISWQEWCDHEMDRFISHGKKAEIMKEKGTGMIALMVDKQFNFL